MTNSLRYKETIKMHGFELLFEDNFEKWNCICDSISYLPIQYKSHFIEYNAIYYQESGLVYDDISIIIRRGGLAVGVWPLCVFKNENGFNLGSLGTEILPPIFIDDFDNIEKKRSIIEDGLILLEEIAQSLDIKSIKTIDLVMAEGLSLWGKKVLEKGANLEEVRYQLYYDLYLPVESANIRRTNKYSIKKGKELFDVRIINKNDDDIYKFFSSFHQLHVETAGRETSGIGAWNSLRDGIVNSNDFLVMLYDKANGRLAGAALFVTTKTTGYYAVAAYNRDLFDKPVGHVVQATAIEYMQSLGLRWYDIGERYYNCDKSIDQKIINISHYKEGFATNTYLKTVIRLNYN